jgi:dCTP deaminase
MSILSDRQIAELAEQGMIHPFEPRLIRRLDDQRPARISYGVSSYGYDVRLSDEFKIFTNLNAGIIDPKRLDENCLVSVSPSTDEWGDQFVLLPPNSYLLGRTVEWFSIPRDVMVVCLGKSTYARAGVLINVTPAEPEFKGNIVIEIANATSLPVKIYANEGIAQFLFLQGTEPCTTSYNDRDGKYQYQTGIQLPLA